MNNALSSVPVTADNGTPFPRDYAELAVSLFCRGLRIDPSCDLQKQMPLTQRRAGLGSGLEIILPGRSKNIYLNVPVVEKFAAASPYTLIQTGEGYYICAAGLPPFSVLLPTCPQWYRRTTSNGVIMSQIGVLQGTYLGIYLGNPCAFWQMHPPVPCKFCASGLNVGIHEAAEKTVADVVETALAARKESHITFVHFNSGYQQGNHLTQVLPYIKAVKTKVGALVGIQCIPAAEDAYLPLLRAGVDHFSFCYEFHNPQFFSHYLPGKSRYIGQEKFFRAMEYVAARMPKGSVSGEIIAGIEPLADTRQAIDYITDLGAFPTICIFRPLVNTALADYPSPAASEMTEIFRYAARRCLQKGIPLGLVPNLEVSLVMTPDDCRYLLPRDRFWYYHHYRLQALKIPARLYFYLKSSRYYTRLRYFLQGLLAKPNQEDRA